MVLASQTPRKTNTWRHMTNERRRGRSMSRLLLWGGVVAAVAIGTWAVFFRTPSEGQGPDDSSVADAPTDSTGAGTGSQSDQPAERSRAAEAIRGSSDPQVGRGQQSSPSGDAGAAPGVITMGGRDAPTAQNGAGSAPEAAGSPGEPPAGGASDGASGSPSDASSPRVPPAGHSPGPSPDQSPGQSSPTPGPAGPSPKGPSDDGAASGSRPRTGAEGAIAPEPLSAAIALAERDPVAARARLSAMIEDARFSPAEQSKAREAVGAINRRLLLAPVVVPGDPLSRTYTVKSGDSLQKIARAQGLGTDWRFIKRVNGIDDERKLKSGQTLKLVPGVFHAIVDKSDYRMDVFVEEAGQRTFVCSLPVGLGEFNSTPTGRFKVRQSSKLVNPAWTNPRTGEHFRADDPKNPIGEFWIGLKGIDKANEGIDGYGIHGTVDPASIGRQASMGCVRLAAPDIALVYELVTEPDSVVEIRE